MQYRVATLHGFNRFDLANAEQAIQRHAARRRRADRRAAAAGIAYMPHLPLGDPRLLESATLSAVATRVGAAPMQVALAWLLKRSPNILPIPGTASLAHLSENIAAAALDPPPSEIEVLDDIAPRRHAMKCPVKDVS